MWQLAVTTHPPNKQGGESYYDLIEDWELIESSFVMQYGIRLRQNDDMSWNEFCSLLTGIMYDTPLGRVVSIRAEKDQKVIKNFSEEEKRIRNEWMKRKNKKMMKNPEAYNAFWRDFQTAMKRLYG